MAQTRTKERGAIAAEFALILPLIVLLIFGIVQFGIAFQRFEAVNAAAREGARVASLPSNSISGGEACTRANAALSGSNMVAKTCTQSADCDVAPSTTVTVTFDHLVEIPFWPGGPRTLNISATGDFRCE